MTEHEPKAPDDRELDEFLSGRGPLSRAWKEGAPQEAAPPELDAPVLAAAREELRRARPRRRLLRWDSPLALAASMFLVLGLGVLVWRQMPRPGQATSMNGQLLDEAGVASRAQPGAPAPAAASPMVAQEPQAEADRGAPPAALAKDKKAEAPARQKETAPAPVPFPADKSPAFSAQAPAPNTAPLEQSSAPAAEASRDSLERKQETAPKLQQPSAGLRAESPPPKAAPDKPSAMAAQDAREAVQEQEQARIATEAAPAPVLAPAAPPPPPAMTTNAPSAGSGNYTSAGSAAGAARTEAAPLQSYGGARGMVQQADACDSPQRMPAQRRDRPELKLDAVAWLEQIRGLRGAASFTAARVELACFRARYPQAAVPDDLKDLLPP